MAFGHDRIINIYGEPVQQSMTINRRDVVMLNTYKLMLGVVLEVTPSDSSKNRSSFQTEDRRGYLHTATVLVIEDGSGTYMTLENVIITPDTVSGLDDYYERLPRGCSSQITGANFNSQINHIDPYSLDGDWCVVGFLGGNMDQPFILRWWPHAKNTFDPATSGQRNPNSQAKQQYLDQAGRVFQRVNGVEFVVTRQGDIYLSTHFANSRLKFGEELAQEEGRFPRTLDEETGGSIKAWLKTSQSLEFDWNPPVDGLGVLDIRDPQIPQTNPRAGNQVQEEKENTYILVNKDSIDATAPGTVAVGTTSMLLEAEEDCTLTTSTLLIESDNHSIDTTTLKLDATDVSADIQGTLDVSVTSTTKFAGTAPVTIQADSTLDITANGAVNLTSNGALTLAGSTISLGAGGASGGVGSITASPGGLVLGNGSLGGVVGGTNLLSLMSVFQSAVAAAAASATVDAAAWAALNTAVQAMVAALPTAISTTTTVG